MAALIDERSPRGRRARPSWIVAEPLVRRHVSRKDEAIVRCRGGGRMSGGAMSVVAVSAADISVAWKQWGATPLPERILVSSVGMAGGTGASAPRFGPDVCVSLRMQSLDAGASRARRLFPGDR